MRPFLALVALAALAFGAQPALSQQFGCHSVPRFHVNAIEQKHDAGTLFAVKVRKPGDKSACRVTESSADFVVGANGDPLWFEALTPRYLIMTRSTGPQGDVVIFDLDRRSYVLDAPADEVAVSATSATFWERKAAATRKNCPQLAKYKADGLGAVITAETKFDFASGVAAATGQLRCDPTQ
ncbi:MAG TPA: hypothetical protein VNS02_13710 [Rhizobiaceae bacterium]|nr:hypothetical protein [Rhizobiaceae bacterium]